MNIDLKGKVAVITGGAGVLGGSISKSLIAEGVKIAVITRSQESLDKATRELSPFGEFLGIQCDVLSIESLKTARAEILQEWGKIDILVNVAGGNMPGATLEKGQTIFDMKIDDFDKVTNLNLNGTIYSCLVFGEAMSKQKEGCIINISSMASLSAITRVPGYSVAKSGVDIFTKWLAMEMALKFGEKIRVNAIAPGFFIGKQNKRVLLNEDGTYTDRSLKILAHTPMGRFGDIDELNGLVHFLCSEQASFITGSIIPVDGGFSSFSGI